jgi:hypothetical protein
MSKKQYPDYPPSYREVPKIGGYFRQCLVVELLCLQELDNTQLAQVQERLEAALSNLPLNSIVEKTEVVTSDRFDPVLRQGLRLPK